LARRRLLAWTFGVLGSIVLIAAGVAALFVSLDLRSLIEEYGSRALDRRLTIGDLRIGWGDPLSVELRDVRLANASWGSPPEMVEIDRVSAEVDLRSLLAGAPRLEKLSVVKPVVVLERNAEGVGNWKFGQAALSSAASSLSSPTRPGSRSGFPTLIDLALSGGNIRFRTSSGNWLDVKLGNLAIRSTGPDQPVTIALDGAYNNITAKLIATAQSFDALRNSSQPYGIEFSITNASTALNFKGTLTDPLNFDGVGGSISSRAQKLGDLLQIFNAESTIDPQLQFAGALKRKGSHWQISNAQGKLAGNAFTGALVLEEGPRGHADDISVDLSFPELDLNTLLGGAGGSKGKSVSDWTALPLHLEEKRGTNIAWHLVATLLKYGRMRLAAVATQGKLASGAVNLEQLKLALAGGALEIAGSVNNLGDGGHVMARATLSGVDAEQLSRLAGADAGQFAGRLDGGATLDMAGKTMESALKAGRGHAVVSITGGHVARDLIEQVSADLRSLLRKREGMVQVTCLLGVIDLANGLGTIWPLRLRTPDGTLVGFGQADFLRQRLDLTIQTVSASTSFFAMDVPVRISGDFRNLQVQPQIDPFAAAPPLPSGRDPLHGMPPDMQAMATRNACLR
jgi:uncharacterized protein involved in outer membrane biogenesis